MHERRQHPRTETNRIALLRFDGGKFESCRVVNLSLGGALLRSSHAANLPDRLALYMDSADRLLQVEVAECAVVRRSGEDVAARFTDVRFVDGLSLGLQ